MANLLRDLQYGLRFILKNWSFSVIAIVTLAIGIGSNTTVFSAVDQALLRPLPYPNTDRLVMIWERNPNAQKGSDELPMYGADFSEIRDQDNSFSQIAGMRSKRFVLSGGTAPEQLAGAKVSASLFSILGVQPLLGRNFLPEEDAYGKDDVIILSYGLWTRMTGSDPAIVGKSLLIDGQKKIVVGVMPAGLDFPRASQMPAHLQFPQHLDVWLPLALAPGEKRSHGTRNLAVLARLKAHVSPQQAQYELDNLGRQLQAAYPESNSGVEVRLVSLREQLLGKVRPLLLLLWGSVTLVLVIACSNVANLQFARSISREQEIALRTALGATRSRIIAQLLTEGVLLGLLGGGLGIAMAAIGMVLVRGGAFGSLAGLDQIHLNGWVLAFSLLLSILSGVLTGLLPAISLSAKQLNNTIKSSGKGAGRSTLRARNILLIGQVASSVALLAGTALVVKGFLHLASSYPGFQPDHVLTMELLLPNTQYKEDISLVHFYQQALDNIRGLPGVQSASIVYAPPLEGEKLTSKFSIKDHPVAAKGQEPLADLQVISPDYFHTMGITLLHGRAFTSQDDENAVPVAIVSQTLASRFWPGENPLGQRIKIGGSADASSWMTVVGIAGDVRNSGLAAESKPELYMAYTQNVSNLMHFVIKTSGDPQQLAGAVRRQILSIDRNQPIAYVETMQDVLSRSIAQQKAAASMLTALSAVAFALTVLGIYGVIDYFVSQRTRELGIRVALGAQRGALMRLVFVHGLVLTASGILLGVLTAMGSSRILSGFLFGISPLDPSVFLAIAGLFLLTSLVATALPAFRAASINPVLALRHD